MAGMYGSILNNVYMISIYKLNIQSKSALSEKNDNVKYDHKFKVHSYHYTCIQQVVLGALSLSNYCLALIKCVHVY